MNGERLEGEGKASGGHRMGGRREEGINIARGHKCRGFGVSR